MDESQERKPGRRPGLNRRDVFYQVYLTKAEKKEIQEHCDKAGITAADYIRTLLNKDRENRIK